MTNAVAAVAAVVLTVTNHLGRALTGEFVRTTPNAVVLRVGSGRERVVPFAALREGERQRILAAVGERRESPVERVARERRERERTRLENMVRDGWMTREEADRLLRLQR